MERPTARWQLWMHNDPLVCLGFPRVLLNWKTLQTEFLFHKSEFSHKIADLCLATVPSGDHMVTARGCAVRRMLQENPGHRGIRQRWIPDPALKGRGWETSPWQQGRGPAPRDRLIREEVESGGWTEEGGAWRFVQRGMADRNVSVNLMFQHAGRHVRSEPQNQFDVSCRELIASSVSRACDVFAGVWANEKKPPPDMLKRFLHVEIRICIFRLGAIAPPDTGWLLWATQASISTLNLEWKECWLQIDALYNPLKSPMRCVLCKRKKKKKLI